MILYASGFLFMLSLGMVLFMIVRRHRMIRIEAVGESLVQKYQNYLAEFIAIPDLESSLITNNQFDETFRLDSKDLTNNFNRDILSNEIYEFHKQLDGHQADQIRQLFLGFSFFELTERRLKSSNWANIVRGIDEARQFNLRELIPLIQKQLHHKHIDVRCQAMMAMVGFDKDAVSTLVSLESKLTDWERHKILFTMQEQHIPFNYCAYPNATESVNSDFLKELDLHLNPEQQLTSINELNHA